MKTPAELLGLAGVFFGGIIVDDNDTDDSGGHLF
jgi:hypothetical protein